MKLNLLAFSIVLLLATEAFACDCSAPRDECHNPAPIAIVATIPDGLTALELLDPIPVKVEEVLKGSRPSEVSFVRIDRSCYFAFEPGHKYVIFGSPVDGSPNIISTWLCAGNFPVVGREHVVEVMRIAASGGPFRLTGGVGAADLVQSVRLSQAKVVVSGHGKAWEYLTAPDGHFDISDLKPGSYMISVSKENYVNDVGRSYAQYVGETIVTESGCAVREFLLWPNGKMSGRVTDEKGDPVAGIRVHAFILAPPNSIWKATSLHSSVTDRDGRYVLSALPAGHYIVRPSIPRLPDQRPYTYQPLLEPGEDLQTVPRTRLEKFEERSGVDLRVVRASVAVQ